MINYGDWQQIQRFVQEQVAAQGQSFLQAKVVKRDTENRLIWVKELGDQPIPLVSFDYELKYHDEAEDGSVNVRTAQATILTPKIGEVVFIGLHMGSRRLPKCLGVIKSRNYVGKG